MRKCIACAIFALMGLAACSPPSVDSSPGSGVSESDVIGTWMLSYDGKTIFDEAAGQSVYGVGTEKVRLAAGGRYEQTFDDGKGGVYPRSESTWSLSKNPRGQYEVILKGMRFFPKGIAAALSNPPQSEIRLLVQESSNLPLMGKKQLILCFEEADMNFCFRRDHASATKTP